MKLIQFGAGNIGRSFIGQLFSLAEWEIVFIDIDEKIVNELNKKRCYNVEIKNEVSETILVENVRGVLVDDYEAVSNEVADADLISTAVGKNALPYIIKPLAFGLKKRQIINKKNALDIIICENIRNASLFFRNLLKNELPPDYPLDKLVGFVETSIGKMVPIMKEEDKKNDLLLVYAEAYNTLIVDKKGFKGKIPEIPEIEAKENIKAYVDRKLFIHNLGHAVLSYVAFVFGKKYKYIWEAAFDNKICKIAKNAMWESGWALIKEYPYEFNEKNIGEHIDDLLSRFKNRGLGDTIYRVGRDLQRKLGPEDRLVGAINICIKQGIIPKNISLGLASALFFKGVDENGKMYDNDILFHEREVSKGVDHVLKNICKLKSKKIIEIIRKYYEKIKIGERFINGDF